VLPSGETICRTPDVLEVQEHAVEVLYQHAKLGAARPKTLSFLSVGLFVCHACDVMLVNDWLVNDEI